jgi:hypothetical protein
MRPQAMIGQVNLTGSRIHTYYRPLDFLENILLPVISLQANSVIIESQPGRQPHPRLVAAGYVCRPVGAECVRSPHHRRGPMALDMATTGGILSHPGAPRKSETQNRSKRA